MIFHSYCLASFSVLILSVSMLQIHASSLNCTPQDSLSLLGEIVGSCIRPSAPDSDVWKAMNDKMLQLEKESQKKRELNNDNCG